MFKKEWTSTKEKMPKNDSAIFVKTTDNDIDFCYYINHRFVKPLKRKTEIRVTHWRLPEGVNDYENVFSLLRNSLR